MIKANSVMLKNKMEISHEQQVEELLTEIENYRKELSENGKDLRYKIGEEVRQCAHSFWRCITLPKKLSEIRKQHRNGQFINMPECKKENEQDKERYISQLLAIRNELKFYSELRWSDLNYRIGFEVLKAFESPWKFLKMPFVLRSVTVKAKSQKTKSTMVRNYEYSLKNLTPLEGVDKCVLFIATNGAGLGHLTRCLAIARKMRRLNPDVEIIFLTTSLALTTVNREGFTAYCVPSLMLIDHMTTSQWNILLRNALMELMHLYPFKAIIFDGAMPYASISAAMAKAEYTRKIWVKRGSEKSGEISEKRNQAEEQFDYIIVPGELGAVSAEEGNRISVDPVIYLDREELWSREEVRMYLKIPANKKVVYIQLGAGNINDIDSDINKILRELRKYPDLIMVLGESMIGNELKIIENDIIIIKDYPNSKYFNGFDFAISACGYNSFHELLYFGVPTLFLPNMNTKTDDQYARAMIAQNAGAGLVVTDVSSEQLSHAVAMLCDDETNQSMRQQAQALLFENGANEAAKFIMSVSGCGTTLEKN